MGLELGGGMASALDGPSAWRDSGILESGRCSPSALQTKRQATAF